MQLFLFGHNLGPLLIILAGSVCLTLGDIAAKLWVQSNRMPHFAVMFGLYMAGLLFLCWSFRFKNIALASLLLIILNVLILAVWSWWRYDEALNRVETAGLLLGIAAVGLLELGKSA